MARSLTEPINPHAGGRTLPMLPKLGYFGVIEQLVTNPKPSQGFLTLVEAGRWNETFEAIVLSNREMFSEEAVASAEKKLALYEPTDVWVALSEGGMKRVP
jgi:hypothetical protein